MKIMHTALVCLTALPCMVAAETIEAPIHRISAQGVHDRLGTLSVRQGAGSVEIRVVLSEFPAGWHAMHVHQNPSCERELQDGKWVAGAASGMHFDPTGVMADMPGMTGDGMDMADNDGGMEMAHNMDGMEMPDADPPPPGRKPRPLGDLPAVYTDEHGVTDSRILSYRLQLDQFRGRSVVLHAHPEASEDLRLPRGGGEKIACAVLPN